MNLIKFRTIKFSYQVFITYLLFFVFIKAVLSHIISSSGLCYDGSYVLLRMILDNSFYFNETSRIFFHALYQLPIWIFIKFFPSNSLSLATQFFSFSLIWIHIFSLTGCWLILPKHKKIYIFFPLFAFLVGPLIALSYSLSISLSVFSYIWLTAFVIYYSDLSLTKHKIILCLIPLPLFFSHELMSYASPLLILLCLLKRNYKKTTGNKIVISALIFCFVITFFIAVYFIIFPAWDRNRDSFFFHLLKLSFLYDLKKNIYVYVCSAFTLVFISFISNLHFSFKNISLILLSLISVTINSLLLFHQLDFFQIFPLNSFLPDDSNRIYIFFILPFTLLLWFLFEKKIFQFKNQKLFLTLCLISSIALVKWRMEMNYKFYNSQEKFSENFQFYKGIHEDKILEEFSFYSNYFVTCGYMISPASLIFPRKNQLKAVILNSPNPECITACQNKKQWKPYHSFDYNFNLKKEQNLYCKKRCIEYANDYSDISWDKVIENKNKFFDFTYLRKHFKEWYNF